jgi:hypothetical protein
MVTVNGTITAPAYISIDGKVKTIQDFDTTASQSLPYGYYTYTNTGDLATATAVVFVGNPSRPPSPLPKTGDGFPLGAVLTLMGMCLAGMGWTGYRMRAKRTKA